MSEAPSPFTSDGWQYVWDSTSLGWYKTCPTLWNYTMRQGWRAKGGNVHLDFGIHYHRAIELYYIARSEDKGHAEALRVAVRYVFEATWIDGKPWAPDHNLKTRGNLVRSVVWYLEEFGVADPATTITLADGKLGVELSFKLDVGDYMLSGHLDRLVEFAGQNYVMDHKTTTQTLGPYYFKQFSPDNQMSLYATASVITYHTPVAGVIVDAAQIAVGFTRFERGFASRSREQLDEWMEDFHYWADDAKRAVESNHFRINDKQCFMCSFRQVCASNPRMREKVLESDYMKHPWNPLENR